MYIYTFIYISKHGYGMICRTESQIASTVHINDQKPVLVSSRKKHILHQAISLFVSDKFQWLTPFSRG